MKSKIMNPHKISAHSDNKQKSYGMLLIELVTWGVTNRDVLLLATIRYFFLQIFVSMSFLFYEISFDNIKCVIFSAANTGFSQIRRMR